MNIDPAIQNLLQTDAGCRQLLKKLRFENGNFVCPNCQHTNAYELSGRPGVYECSGCGKQTSLTAGTFFHGKKLPLNKCFALLIAFIGESSSTSQISRDIGLWGSTAWRWGQQIRLLLNNLFIDDDCVLVDSALLKKILFRRSVETPAIGSEEKITPADDLCNDEERLSILETESFISTFHHGISKKYAQLYAAEFRFSLRSKRYSLKELLGLILGAGPVSVEAVSAYSSPKLIVLPNRSRA